MRIERTNRRKSTNEASSVVATNPTANEPSKNKSPRANRVKSVVSASPAQEPVIEVGEVAVETTSPEAVPVTASQATGNPPEGAEIMFQEDRPHVRAWLTNQEWLVCIEGDIKAPADGWYSVTKKGELVRRHYSKGKLHNQGGPAEISVSKSRQSEMHCTHGMITNSFGPAITVQFAGGERIERFVVNDEDQRTLITYQDGSTFERFSAGSLTKGSVIHRDGGPALIRKNSTGLVLQEEYYSQGKLHRAGDRPAVIIGRHVEYRDRGELHRVAGPALITESGQQFYYLEGKEVFKTSVSKAHLSETGASGVGETSKDIIAHGNHDERRAEMASRVDAWASSKGRKLIA